MDRTRSPRLKIGVLLLSLMLAPLFVAPAAAQDDGNLHYIGEDQIQDGTALSGADLQAGYDVWWERHVGYTEGTYAIVEDPVNVNSTGSLHLGIDADVSDPEDQARLIAYYENDQLTDLRDYFEAGLGYTLMVDETVEEAVLGSTTQLVVEVFYGGSQTAPKFTNLALMPNANTDTTGDDLAVGSWQTFEWNMDSQTRTSAPIGEIAAGTVATLETLLDEIYAVAEDDGVEAVPPIAIGVGLNLGTGTGVTLDTYIDQLSVGEDTFKFGEEPVDLAPTVTEHPESAYQGETVTVTGTNLTDATVVLDGAGEVEATVNEDGTELSFVVPADAALGVRPVVITTPHGDVRFNLEVLERVDEAHPGFTDVPDTHLFFGEIMWLADQDITRGCNPPVNDMFCPDDSITRGQMAAFLNRALGWPVSDVDGFEDDGHSVFEGDLNAAKAEGVFRGCNPPLNTQSCVDDPITRGEMAAVIVRALDLPAGEEDAFTDDDLSVFEGDINALAAADVTRGCNPPANDEFCPDRNMTRGEMAAFLFRALADRLDGDEEAMES